MILVGAVVYAVIVALLLRGQLSRLGELRLRFEPLIPLGLLLQFAVTAIPAADRSIVTSAWLLGALFLLLTVLANWSYLGLRLAGIGVLLNAIVILLNKGMPVAPQALRYLGANDLGAAIERASALYVLQGQESRLVVLGDVLPLPGPTALSSVLSLGDLLLMVGVAVLILQTTGQRTSSAD